MTRVEILGLVGEFTWGFGPQFFIKTDSGNFIWSDPDYGGDNSLRKVNMGLRKWLGGGIGRCKGKHFIGQYCGSQVKIV